MTTENIGIFVGDSEHSAFIGGFSMDLDASPDFDLVIDTLSNRLKKDKFLYGNSYLHYSDAESIRRDNHFEGDDLYDLEPEELTEKTLDAFEHSADPSYSGMVHVILTAFDDTYDEGFTEAYKVELQGAVVDAIADKRKQEEANLELPTGTPVYLRKPDTHHSELKPTPFDKSCHDARKVLPASLVAAKPLGELEIYPTPPSKSKHEPSFWGHFKDIPATKVHFTGHTQRDVKLKAAIYEAWETHFEKK